MIRELIDRKQLHASYRRVFESPEGEQVLQHLMKEGFIMKSTFVAGDTHQTALNEGTRRMVLSILRILGKNPNIVKEGLQDENTA